MWRQHIFGGSSNAHNLGARQTARPRPLGLSASARWVLWVPRAWEDLSELAGRPSSDRVEREEDYDYDELEEKEEEEEDEAEDDG